MIKESKLSPFVTVLLIVIISLGVLVVASSTGLINLNAVLGSDNLLEIKSVGASIGSEKVKVNVFLENPDSISGLQFQLEYPEFVKLVDVEKTNRLDGAYIEFNELEPGLLRIAILSDEGIVSKKSPILVLVFSISDDVIPGKYGLNFSNAVIGDKNAKPLLLQTHNGILTIASNDKETNLSNRESIIFNETPVVNNSEVINETLNEAENVSEENDNFEGN
ncbi:hypothetical protein COU59_02700 [Candidatus Pacearchaeota archaeon CG10_big_fil_rev_8_21_14_0_10_34_12]|nr:MAG: hypothetical protein COU59_02700 [Candidatus Pacearchaeota archaeon CG10_big_fil_rev_8_21_14_0_10_34_12]